MDNAWKPRPYKNYKWIVKDKDLLGGRLAIRGTRISVALILECLAADMDVTQINDEYGTQFDQNLLSEVHSVAAEILGNPDVAA